MTTRADLLRLADRVEREESSDELRTAVLLACGWKLHPRAAACWESPDGRYTGSPPDPLHSLDAAASLVGPTWMATITDEDDDGWAVMLCHPLLPDVYAHAPTEPRARTAAALRAQAQEMKDE